MAVYENGQRVDTGGPSTGESLKAKSRSFMPGLGEIDKMKSQGAGGYFKQTGKDFFGIKEAEQEAGPEGLSYGDQANADIQEVDPRLKAAAALQSRQADDFRANLGSFKQGQQAMVGDSGRRDLAERMAGIKAGANSRGLLYSGLRAGEEAGAQSDLASNLSSAQRDINVGAEEQARGLDEQAAKSGIAVQQAEQERQNKIYQQAMSNQQQKLQRAQTSQQFANEMNAQGQQAQGQKAEQQAGMFKSLGGLGGMMGAK